MRTAFLDVSAQRSAEREARAEKAVHSRLNALERASLVAMRSRSGYRRRPYKPAIAVSAWHWAHVARMFA